MDDVISCSPIFKMYRCHLNRWSFVFFSFKCTTKRPHIHVCAKCVNYSEWAEKPLDSMAHVHITHSLMQTKVTVVSTPSLLFSLGQTTNRSNEKRERKKSNTKDSQKKKSDFCFLPYQGIA